MMNIINIQEEKKEEEESLIRSIIIGKMDIKLVLDNLLYSFYTRF